MTTKKQPTAPSSFAQLAKRARRRCNETQDQFAARLGVHPMTISKWERGEKAPGLPMRRQLRLVLKGQA